MIHQPLGGIGGTSEDIAIQAKEVSGPRGFVLCIGNTFGTGVHSQQKCGPPRFETGKLSHWSVWTLEAGRFWFEQEIKWSGHQIDEHMRYSRVHGARNVVG